MLGGNTLSELLVSWACFIDEAQNEQVAEKQGSMCEGLWCPLRPAIKIHLLYDSLSTRVAAFVQHAKTAPI